jgi:hypothetical protein
MTCSSPAGHPEGDRVVIAKSLFRAAALRRCAFAVTS